VQSKLEILSQVMLSLKDDQNNAMNNINALLNKKDTEEELIGSLKAQINSLSSIHSTMEETQSFIIQLTKETLGDLGQSDEQQEKEEK
jgi:hypothetical protein